jgi:hypothetical protein
MGKTASGEGDLPSDQTFASLKEFFPSFSLSPAQKSSIERAMTLKKQAVILEGRGLKLKALRLRMESDALVNLQVDLILKEMKSSAGPEIS